MLLQLVVRRIQLVVTSIEDVPLFPSYTVWRIFLLHDADFWVCSEIVRSRITDGFGHIQEYLQQRLFHNRVTAQNKIRIQENIIPCRVARVGVFSKLFLIEDSIQLIQISKFGAQRQILLFGRNSTIISIHVEIRRTLTDEL